LDPEWVDSIQDQCAAQSVPFFFKQWGGRHDKGGSLLHGHEFKAWPTTNETSKT
jgi:protein gp37